MTVTPDQILRQQAINAALKTEFAWGGNLTQASNLNGYFASATSPNNPPNNPVSNIISGINCHYDPKTDLDRNWWDAVLASTTGHAGHYINFPALPNGGYGTIPYSSSFNITSKKFSVRGWIYLTGPNSNCGLISATDLNNHQGDWAFGFFSGGNPQIMGRLNNNSKQIIGPNIPLNTWTFVEFSYDGTLFAGIQSMKIYVNGTLVVTADYSAAITNSNYQIVLGGYFAAPYTFNGRMSEWEFRNGTATSADYTPPDTITPSGATTALWHFADGPGSTTAADSSGAGHNASLFGNYSWQDSTVDDFAIIDLTNTNGVNRTFTQTVVYLHPFLSTCDAFNLYWSTDGSTWNQYFTGAGLGRKVVVETNPITARYIKFKAQNAGTDGHIRVVQIEIYNWLDESQFVQRTGDGPDITIASKADPSQNTVPSPSEATIALDNIEGRFSVRNTSSPIYGDTAPDGYGTGVRAGVPCRITAMATDADGNLYSEIIYYGFVTNDDNPGGSTGITADDKGGTATIACKSIYEKLKINVDTPVYEGASADFILRDLCYRCGIADQDIFTSGLNQGVAFIGFSNQPAEQVVNQILEAMPFMRVSEIFSSSGPSVSAVNYGRSRTDVDLSPYITTSGVGSIQNIIADPAHKSLIFETITITQLNMFRWDLTKPSGQGLTQLLPTFVAGLSFPMITKIYNGTLYYATLNGLVFTWDPTSLTFNPVQTSANFGTIVAGYGPLSYYMRGKYIYCIIRKTLSPFDQKLVVWDVTQNFSTAVVKGVPPHDLDTDATNGKWNSNIGGDDNYLVWRTDDTHIDIWKHNGTPYTTGFVNGVDIQHIAYFSGSTIAGEDYTKNLLYIDSNSNMWIAVAILHASDSMRRHEFWKLNIAAAWASPSSNATKAGVVKDNTFASIGYDGSSPKASFMVNGTYLYYADSESNIYVWDSTKDFSFLFLIGVGNTGASFAPSPSSQGFTNKGVGFTKRNVSCMGPDMNSVDHTNRVWMSVYNSSSFPTAHVSGYTVQNVNQFSLTPAESFDLLDKLTVDMKMADGNPFCNRIQLGNTPFAQSNTRSSQWKSQSQSSFYFPSNQKTTIPIQTGNLSARGYGLATTTNRYIQITIGGSTVILWDSPTANQPFVIGSNTYGAQFFGYAGACFLTIDATGLPSVNVTAAEIFGLPVAMPSNSEMSIDKNDPASFKLYKRDFIQDINSPMFNDPSFFQDFLYYGKFGRTYMQGISLPWYPIVKLSQPIGVSNPRQGMPQEIHEVIEYQHHGFKTDVKSKRFFATFII